jgi:plasmid replication initiation protein
MINGMKSTYSIRLYEIFLTKKYGKGIQDLDIGVNELKMMLGVADKYSNIGDFNSILYKSIDEINELTDLTSKIEYKRRKTTIVGYIFKLEEKAKD